MIKPDYDIFISYRRGSGLYLAKNIATSLQSFGYKVFFDYDSMHNDEFDTQIYKAIESSKDFILVLTEGALDRCYLDNDWVKREILCAKSHNKNIILATDDERFKDYPDNLPASLDFLKKIDWTPIHPKLFEGSLKLLCKRLTSHRKSIKYIIGSLAILAVMAISLLLYIVYPSEILQYLDNKFGIGTKKYQKAMIIKNKCNGLLSRAMILNFIDDVLSIALDNKITSFKIYYTIIEKWLCRELRIEKIGDSLDEIRKLYRFSTDIAMYMYRSGKQYIVKDEYRMFCEKHGYISDPYSYNTRSLITRRNDGAIMFAHKSFFDFFIAVIAFERPEVQFDSNSFESKEFVKEINKYYLCEEKLPLINYYQLPFECEDFTSEAIDKILNNCECIFDVSYECNEDVNVKMHELICTLWMQLAKRLKRHFENISIENRNGEYLNGLQEWLVVTHIIYKVQKIFLSIEDINKVKNELIEIRDDISELKNMKMGYQKDKMATYQINTYQNEIIVYPCVIDNEMFAKINRYTCIILGGAFSNDKEVLSTLKDLLESESVKNIYILLKENNSEYIINRIGQIVVLIKSIGSKFNKETIVQLLSDRFCYIVSIDTLIRSKDEICKCVNNMLKQ